MGQTIAGLPVSFTTDSDGFYTRVAFQNVTIEGSPLNVVLDPPVATIEEANLAGLVGLIGALARGAIINM